MEEEMKLARRKQHLEALAAWQEWALATGPADRPRAEQAIADLYASRMMERPRVLWVDSPRSALPALAHFVGRDRPGGEQVWPRLRSPGWLGIGPHEFSPARHFLVSGQDDLGPYLSQRVYQALQQGSDLHPEEVWARRFLAGGYPAQWEGHWIARIGAYGALEAPMRVPDREWCRIEPWIELAQSCCWIWPYEHLVVACEHPLEIHLTGERLHCEVGPAVVFGDGWGVWALNGVVIPREVGEPPPEEVDPQLALTEENADVRREIVRKVGLERLCQAFGAQSVDRDREYELLLLDLGDRVMRPFLKMRNPSIDAWHIEGVTLGIRSVAEAIAWRNGTSEKPVALS